MLGFVCAVMEVTGQDFWRNTNKSNHLKAMFHFLKMVLIVELKRKRVLYKDRTSGNFFH